MKSEFEQFVLSLLQCETLAVLAGLGTSLGLMNREPSGALAPAGAPTMSDLFALVSEIPGYEDCASIAPEAVRNRDVESLLSAVQAYLTLHSDDAITAFLWASEKAIARSCNFVGETADLSHHELFLRKIVRRQDRLSRLQLFTTNYDVAFESAADSSHIHVIDGFGVGRRGSFDGGNFDLDIVRRTDREAPALEATVIHLLKLHGSVDWTAREGGVYHEPGTETPVLIYPAADKYQMSFRPPYLECMSRWQVAMRKPSLGLLIVGFGCNDAHIVGPLEAALRGNPGLRVLFVSPNVDSYDNPTIRRVRRLIELGDERVATLGATFDQLVERMPTGAQTDAHEQHMIMVDTVWGTTT